MSSIRLRSPRDPEFWVPLLLCLLVILPLAFGGYFWTMGKIEDLEILAAADPAAAIERAESLIRRAARLFCAVMAVFCGCLFRYCQLARREGRLPPSGWWSYGSLQAVVGGKARQISRLGQWFAGLLLAATIGLLLAVEQLLTVFGNGAPPA